MTNGQSDPRVPMRPTPKTTPRGAINPNSGYPRPRALTWTAALVAGGGALIVTFFFAIGVIDLVQFPSWAYSPSRWPCSSA